MKRAYLILGFITGIVLISRPSAAQYTADYQINIISGVSSNWSGDYIVGSNTLADVLLIQNSGILSNGNGYLGYEIGSSNNSVVVTDPGSAWTNNGVLYVGYGGTGNSLVISNGANMYTFSVSYLGFVDYVGYGSGSGNNSVLVTGTDSVWNSSSGGIIVGGSGSSNSLTINNGARIISSRGQLGGQSNSVVVAGGGSVWNAGTASITLWGANNSFVISNGGKIVGMSAINGSSNTILVTGSGSGLSNRAVFYVAEYGIGDSLVISNGGQVIETRDPSLMSDSYIGESTGNHSNSVIVTGTGSIWSNTDNLYIAYDGGSNRLVVSHGGRVADSTGYVGYQNTGSFRGCNTALVADPNSVWTNFSDLHVGYGVPNNSLVISNGGRVFNGFGDIGASSGGSNNLVIVAGSGSIWSNQNDLSVGVCGAGNSLVISGGGKVFDAGGHVSQSSSCSNNGTNSVEVTDAGSMWVNSGSLTIGYWGVGNSLVISNGGKVFNSDGNMGGGDGRSNTVLVTDTGSVWSNTGTLSIGAGKREANNLTIKNGAAVFSSYGFVGSTLTNSVFVTDPGSVWSNRNDLVVGNMILAGLNSLVISNGGWVANRDGTVGLLSSSNSVRVVDGGVWNNRGMLVLGAGSSNSLTIAGGSVACFQMLVGGNVSTCDNVVELDSGSLTDTGTLEVRYGKFVFNGGVLQADTLVLNNECGLFLHYGGALQINHLQLDPTLSAVGDGIPNGWKQQYGLDPLDPNLANEDLNGSGFTVLQDYLAGTDPTNPAACFHITSVVRTNDNDLCVTWTMGPGKTNALQATAGDVNSGYDTNNFSDIFTVTNTVGTTTNYLDSGGATNSPARYYRVRVVQ